MWLKLTIKASVSNVSTVDVEQVNVSWDFDLFMGYKNVTLA